MKIIKLIMTLLLFCISINAIETETVKQVDFENKMVTVDLNGYKILKFTKTIKKINFDSSDYIEADFLKDSDIPLATLKVKGKKIGKQNAIVTFQDDSVVTVKFNIVKNINDVIQLVNTLYPNINVSQINDTIVLQGHVLNQTQKRTLIDIFKKYGIDTDAKVINLIKDNYSTKMVRVKLYVVQINNDKGQQIINQWTTTGSGDLFGNELSLTDLNFDNTSITSLAGGIAAVASYAGSQFNIAYTLNYLRKNNAVRILNESTLIMKEEEESSFNSGGSFKVPTTSTANNGTTSSGYEDVDYGLNIKIKVNKIIENQYVDFTASAENTEIDNDNTVDGIPGTKGDTLTTNVLIENGSTIVLAGILKVDSSEVKEEIPGLADIPLLGELFKSSNTFSDNNDLVFFMTPEIVDPMNNDQSDLLNKKVRLIKKEEKKEEQTIEKEKKESVEKSSSSTKTELTDEEKHRQRVNKILYGN